MHILFVLIWEYNQTVHKSLGEASYGAPAAAAIMSADKIDIDGVSHHVDSRKVSLDKTLNVTEATIFLSR